MKIKRFNEEMDGLKMSHGVPGAIPNWQKPSNKNVSDTSDDSNLESLIQNYFDENLVGEFSDRDAESVKNIIKDFVKHYLN